MHICRTLDSDGSGFLDLKEFLLAIELVAARTPEDKLLWAFRQYDTDNSGCVDRGAFKNYVAFEESLFSNTKLIRIGLRLLIFLWIRRNECR